MPTNRVVARVAAALSVVVVMIAGSPAHVWAASPPFVAPVSAPVTAGFVAPDGPYGRGHRGLDYGVVAGTPVSAVGAGIVVFAGSVAGQGYVTVLHPNGLRSTVSYVAGIAVRRGQRVTASTVLALTTTRLLLTIRSGSTYLDPAPLLAGRRVRPRHAHLVR